MIIENKVYDDDSQDEVWNCVYSEAYGGEKILGTVFNLKEVSISETHKRNVAKISKDVERIKETLEIGGETDFNFSKKIGIHRQSKYGIYKKILNEIKDNEKKVEAIALLDHCEEQTRKIVNFSLMLCNGSLQTLKGTLDKDRIDVFIYLLHNYFMGRDELILSHCAPCYVKSLKEYLDLFKDENSPHLSIYKYCLEIYHIKNKKLVKNILDSGKKAINTPDRVIEYMNLAIRFWKCKAKYYEEIGIVDKGILELWNA